MQFSSAAGTAPNPGSAGARLLESYQEIDADCCIPAQARAGFCGPGRAAPAR